ncbi:tRNA(Ile)-lysidine synthase TilS [Alcanivorax sp. S71-1-4]|uniref:tRNA lysidine(34) synthetase TilS n=1 Tax=Alcanivorax sp. S71-1-4 TaxID=1177159 RepID=UPI00135CC21D|nr:tRNA lysidine(34) synthetase TilS [Alcanivorax sp. S71-1-4]KAF0807255.1 tRNA(Ile)-lysidine synthase TilS [Alcanivorax sp. S71-1-4]
MADATPTTLTDHLRTQLAGVRGRLVLGFSGGLDSTVLLAALVRAGFGERLLAAHVAHGLQVAADGWAAHCAAVAREFGVDCQTLPLDLTSGSNLEARAREARRTALLALTGEDDALLLAHHADDQAETLLLNLLRGGGPAGLAAMASPIQYAGRTLIRPLLGWRRADLAELAAAWGLRWVEDPTNAELDANRNFLRHEILPRLAQRWPSAVDTLVRGARLQGEAAGLMAELAQADRDALVQPDGALDLGGFAALSPARRRNLLYGWLRALGLQAPPLKVLNRVLDELLTAGEDRQPQVAWEHAVFRRYRDGLYLLSPAALLPVTGEATLRLEEGSDCQLGPLRVSVQAGVAGDGNWHLPRALTEVTVSAAPRGARLRQGGMARDVRELWRAAGIPPWQRARLPVLCQGGQLLAAAQIGVADQARMAPDEPAWLVHWQLDGGHSGL